LTRNQGYGNGILSPLLDSLRKQDIEDNLGRLRKGDLSAETRLQLVNRNRALGKVTSDLDERDVSRDALAALRDGLYQSSGFKRYIDDPLHLYDIYCELTSGGTRELGWEAWDSFGEILDMVGGEPQFERAVTAHHYVEERILAGEERDVAIGHALHALSLGRDPHEVPPQEDGPARPHGTVERRHQQVHIDGVAVPVRAVPQAQDNVNRSRPSHGRAVAGGSCPEE